ncbi:MAG TPA: ribosome-associated translation inhibitor RaiA [Actinomycetota bacterium]|nr:ribosome-associated translation inhibitor RaiA [Actinomycetota bacterium]
MELVVKGRGDRVSAQAKIHLERKLARLARLDPRVGRVEVEVIRQPSRRVDGGHRVEASCRSSRRTYRARATGTDLDAALDRAVGRLERQIADDHARRRTRMLNGANRLKSRRDGAGS